MKRLSVRRARPLKILHLGCVALWIGGVASWLPLVWGTEAAALEETRLTYLNMRAIAFNVIGWGGIGSFATGLALGGVTTWRIFRRRWVVAKLVMTIAGVLFGMFFIEQRMLEALTVLDASPVALEQVAAHRHAIQIGLVCQLALFLAIVAVAVFKPGERAYRAAHRDLNTA